MKHVSFILSIGCLLAWFTSSARAADLAQIDGPAVQRVARKLVKAAEKLEKLQVTIPGDPEKAVGLKFRDDGIVIVPARDLKEEEEVPDSAKSETGAGFAFLFLSENFVPLKGGSAIDDAKLRIVTLTDDEGRERKIKCLLLAARKLSDDTWSLYAYGSAPKPLVDSKFADAVAAEDGKTLSLRITDIQGRQGKLEVTVFGKYEAPIAISYLGD